MYPNSHLRWASPSVHFVHQEGVLKTPSYKHLVLTAILFTAVLLGGTAQAIKMVASKQVAYQPSAAASVKPEAQPTAVPAPKAPAPTSQPAVTPPAINHSAKVQSVLDSWNAAHPSQKWSVAVQGLGTDQTKAVLNPNTPYDTASIYKLFLMYPLFKSYDLNSLANSSLKVEGRGVMNLKTCVGLAIKNSDNPCGEALGYRLGWGKSTALLRQLGMSGTNLNGLNGVITTTAADANLFLQKLYDGELMSADEQQYLIGLMQQQIYRGGIPTGCPGCTVADKIGDLGFVRHDVAIVTYPGGSYILAVMTNGAPYSQIAELTGQIQAAINS